MQEAERHPQLESIQLCALTLCYSPGDIALSAAVSLQCSDSMT